MRRHALARIAATLLAITPSALGQQVTPPAWLEFAEPGSPLVLPADKRGSITLKRGDQSIPLETKWRKADDAGFSGRSILPETIQPGTYETHLDADSESLNLNTTLHVLPEPPQNLRFWINGVPDSSTHESDSAYTPDILLDYNESATETSLPRIPLADPALRPTLPRALRIGEINLLIFDINDHSDRALGNLHILRRKLKNKPVTIAITVASPRDIPFRAKSILFIDDPVQALILAPATEETNRPARLQRWSEFIPVIDAGAVSQINVTPAGVTAK